ncbi:MAG: hypothetical protein II886_07545 [Prevotella sp.]|nr:hypothetical protein [Prevotella sp.]
MIDSACPDLTLRRWGTVKQQINPAEVNRIPQWLLHYCLSCLHRKNEEMSNYSSRQCAAFRTIASVLAGCKDTKKS